MASQITSITTVYSVVYSGADQSKHQSSASLAFLRGIQRWPVNSPHKGPVTRKVLPFDYVIMYYLWNIAMQHDPACIDQYTDWRPARVNLQNHICDGYLDMGLFGHRHTGVIVPTLNSHTALLCLFCLSEMRTHIRSPEKRRKITSVK